MPKKLISLDMDGTIGESVKPVLDLFHKSGGIKLRLDDIKNHDLREMHYPDGKRPDPELVQGLFRHAYRHGLVGLVDPNIPTIVNSLRNSHQVRVLSTTVAERNDVLRFLRKHRIGFDDIVFADQDKDKVMNSGSAHVDDDQRLAEAMAGAGKRVLLLRRPWNRSLQESPPKIRAFASWNDIALALAKE